MSTSITFHNGSNMRVNSEDIRIERTYRFGDILYDEFAGIDLLSDYTFYLKDGKIDVKKKTAPDFGEFSPSQELNDFVNTLIQG